MKLFRGFFEANSKPQPPQREQPRPEVVGKLDEDVDVMVARMVDQVVDVCALNDQALDELQRGYSDLVTRSESVDKEHWDKLFVDDSRPVLYKAAVIIHAIADRDGIQPARLRGLAWMFLSTRKASETCPVDSNNKFTRFLELACPAEVTRDIWKDVERTKTRFASINQQEWDEMAHFEVLRCYAAFDPAVGYCQGLNFLAGVLVAHMSRQAALGMLIRLMETYKLRSLFVDGMEEVERRLQDLTALIKVHLPDLHERMKELNVCTNMYATGWIMTLMTNTLPLAHMLRLLDVFFVEGIAVILRCILAFLYRKQAELLACDRHGMLLLLQNEVIEDGYTPQQFIHDVLRVTAVIPP